MCGTCEFAKGDVAYDGNDLLTPGAPCPDWWESLEAGDCKVAAGQVALIFPGGKEACCTFCIEYNRRGLQPPCTHASFGPSGSGVQDLCYVKTGTPAKLTPSKYPRASFLAGLPCATYEPPTSLGWGFAFLLALTFVLVTYVAGGTRMGARRHPHTRAWHEFWGLVVDGWHFSRNETGPDRTGSSSRGKKATESLHGSLLPASNGTEGVDAPPKQAMRGPSVHTQSAAACVC